MKRLFFLICLSLIAGAFVFQQTSNGSGYVLISLGGTTVEMSFWTAVFILLGILLALYLLVRLIVGFIHLLTGGANQLMSVSGKTVQRRTARGLVEFIEGNWAQSRKHLLKSARKSDDPLINYLAAARSSYELGNEEEAFDLLHKAQQSSATSGLAVALTQARMLLAANKYEQCMANLERAREIAPQHPVVLELLQKTYQQLEDWRSLQKLMPDLRRHKILPASELSRLEVQLYAALLDKAGTKAKLQSAQDGPATIEDEWMAMPAPLRKKVDLQKVYVRQLLKVGAEAKVESFLRRELKKTWDESLVATYGRVEGKDVQKQLLVAEHWQQEHPGDAVLLLTLGRLCLRNREWTRARDYFESSLKLRKDPDTYAELARLLAHQGEHTKSTEYYQQGLLMTTAGLPKLPMPEPAGKSPVPATGLDANPSHPARL
ncbi:heme biosynthesis HemY N-terminal domain-containing protein [Gilvimarinus sp. F26214L]|uniref:heme biosynthesis HemY N-terminal domain-containing protein n=1 Tax=Gilvimarinus sp. DZF01 TaxID=3461371 RepID=UPI004045D087